jgi:hypothetical protein
VAAARPRPALPRDRGRGRRGRHRDGRSKKQAEQVQPDAHYPAAQLETKMPELPRSRPSDAVSSADRASGEVGRGAQPRRCNATARARRSRPGSRA